MKQAELFDIDGTLLDHSSIRDNEPHLLAVEQRSAYNARAFDCPPHPHVVAAFRSCQRQGRLALIVTARERQFHDMTQSWLARHALFPDGLWMRNTGDSQSDTTLKMGFLAEIRATHTVVKSWEDNPYVAKAYADYGIPTELIPGWVE